MPENNFIEWLLSANTQEKELYERICDNLDLFDDMRFQRDSVVDPYIRVEIQDEQGNWIDDTCAIPDTLACFDPAMFNFRVEEIGSGFLGYFEPSTNTICIDPHSLNNNSVILHEMIHMHESILDALPKFYHDVLLIALYNSLKPQIADLDDRILNHTHIHWGRSITSKGGDHDILFLLKSYDLDLHFSFKLGTVCGYGRDDYKGIMERDNTEEVKE